MIVTSLNLENNSDLQNSTVTCGLRIETNDWEFYWEGATDTLMETLPIDPIISLVVLVSFTFLTTGSNV